MISLYIDDVKNDGESLVVVHVYLSNRREQETRLLWRDIHLGDSSRVAGDVAIARSRRKVKG